MVFIQTLAERTRYTGLSEVAEQITNYQTTAFLPKIKAKDIDKEGGNLERAVRDIKQLENGRFVIDGRVAEPFKPRYSVESDYFRPSSPAVEDYNINNHSKLSKEEDIPLHREIEERIRDSKYRNMGIPFGTGKHFTPKQNDFWKILSKMGSYFALTTVTYSLA